MDRIFQRVCGRCEQTDWPIHLSSLRSRLKFKVSCAGFHRYMKDVCWYVQRAVLTQKQGGNAEYFVPFRI